jgi:hypothetical protein
MNAMKYYAHIRHIDGTIITTIADNNKRQFIKTCAKAQENLVNWCGCSDEYNENELYLEVV